MVSTLRDPRLAATTWRVWALIGVLSVGVPVGLFAFMRKATEPVKALELSQNKPKPVRVRFSPSAAKVAKAVPPKPVPPPPKPLELSGQIVDIAPPKVEAIPDKSNYLAKFDSVAKREKKAEKRVKAKERRAGAVVPKASPLQSPESKSPAETVASSKPAPEAAEATPRKVIAPDREDGVGRPSEVARDQGSRLLLPTTDRDSALANVQTLSGSGALADFLPDVEDEGSDTLLNTRKFQYWDYFHTIQERVRDQWQAGEVYQRRDPSGKVFGVKDRLTVLRVTLDSDGRVAKLITTRDSGVDALDREARRALKAAGPFTNPPKEMLDKGGNLTFQFSFMLELSTSRLRISRVPM